MSPDSDAYWVGALSMAAARALSLMRSEKFLQADRELDHVLERFSQSPFFEGLEDDLAPYWVPRKEIV